MAEPRTVDAGVFNPQGAALVDLRRAAGPRTVIEHGYGL